MTQGAQDTADLAAVGCDRDPSVVVGGEDGVEHALGAGVLRTGRFARLAVPELVVLCEPGLDVPGGE